MSSVAQHLDTHHTHLLRLLQGCHLLSTKNVLHLPTAQHGIHCRHQLLPALIWRQHIHPVCVPHPAQLTSAGTLVTVRVVAHIHRHADILIWFIRLCGIVCWQHRRTRCPYPSKLTRQFVLCVGAAAAQAASTQGASTPWARGACDSDKPGGWREEDGRTRSSPTTHLESPTSHATWAALRTPCYVACPQSHGSQGGPQLSHGCEVEGCPATWGASQQRCAGRCLHPSRRCLQTRLRGQPQARSRHHCPAPAQKQCDRQSGSAAFVCGVAVARSTRRQRRCQRAESSPQTPCRAAVR